MATSKTRNRKVMTDLKDFHDNLDRMNAAQSKANMQKEKDDYAIEFADWLIKRQTNYFESLKKLLEIFKKERK